MHPEELGLDRERMLRLADAYAGYADALGDDRPEVLPWAASSRLLAAVYRSLVDPGVAAAEFAAAARAYAGGEAPLGAILAVCAGDDGLVRERVHAAAEGGIGGGPLERLALALARRWLMESDDPPPELDARGDEEGAARFAFSPAGRLGIPVAAYAQAFTEVEGAARERWDAAGPPAERRYTGAREGPRALPALAGLLERAAEPVLAAMADRFHWRRGLSAILPAEPEMVAACRCVLRIWSRRRRTMDELFALVAADQVHPVALVPLELAADLDDGQESGDDDRAAPAGGPGAAAGRMDEDDYAPRMFGGERNYDAE